MRLRDRRCRFKPGDRARVRHPACVGGSLPLRRAASAAPTGSRPQHQGGGAGDEDERQACHEREGAELMADGVVVSGHPGPPTPSRSSPSHREKPFRTNTVVTASVEMEPAASGELRTHQNHISKVQVDRPSRCGMERHHGLNATDLAGVHGSTRSWIGSCRTAADEPCRSVVARHALDRAFEGDQAGPGHEWCHPDDAFSWKTARGSRRNVIACSRY